MMKLIKIFSVDLLGCTLLRVCNTNTKVKLPNKEQDFIFWLSWLISICIITSIYKFKGPKTISAGIELAQNYHRI